MNTPWQFNPQAHQVVGPAGKLSVGADDRLAQRFLMLVEGECLEESVVGVAQKYGFSRQRYYQLLEDFNTGGLLALEPQKTGPKTNYRRTDQVVRQVLRHCFLDPDASPAVVAQKLRQTRFQISLRSIQRIIADYGLQKKLYALNPKNPPPPLPVQGAAKRVRLQPADERSLERGVRQLLADKISGNLLGLFLLVPEHLRLGSWDLLRTWTADSDTQRVAPRLALHLVHEAALCRSGLRADRSLRHRGFELVNGLPWLPTDGAVHDLLEAHTVQQAHQLQIALGKLRRASGHFAGRVLALDPHRLVSYSKRDMIARRPASNQAAVKQAQTFFLLDAQTAQPVCLTLASGAANLSRSTEELLGLAQQILPAPQADLPLIAADVEHFTVELLDHVRQHTPFDLLVPLRQTTALRKYYQALPQQNFVPQWAGFAIASEAFQPRRSRLDQPFQRYIQRCGERPQDYHFKGFCCTRPRNEVSALTRDFPDRWHIEEFFRFDQHLGWKRAGTLNLHVRLGQMTLALVAQAVIHQLRQRLGAPFSQWDAVHFAQDWFTGLEGDVRVQQDTILVTYYNAPQAELWKKHFENLPQQLQKEGVDPRVPWLYNFKLDFRFK
jgi:hypothetical protein